MPPESSGSGPTAAGILNWGGETFAKGAAFNHGSVLRFAAGDIFDNSTLFPMSGGRTGMLGEDGPEAIMLLTRASDGKLGVRSVGSGGNTYGGHTITINYHYHGGSAQQVDRANWTSGQQSRDLLRIASAHQARLG